MKELGKQLIRVFGCGKQCCKSTKKGLMGLKRGGEWVQAFPTQVQKPYSKGSIFSSQPRKLTGVKHPSKSEFGNLMPHKGLGHKFLCFLKNH